MKKLCVVSIVIAMLCLGGVVSNADTILAEDFEGVVGNNITTLGWTARPNNGPITVSSNVIDSGYSAVNGYNYDGWSQDYKLLSTPHILSVGESVELTWVGKITNGSGQGVQLQNSIGTVGWLIYARDRGISRDFLISAGTTSEWVQMAADVGNTIDARVRLTRDSSEFFYRNHGATSWTQIITSQNTGTGDIIPDRAWLSLYGAPNTSYVDSIKVSTITAVPEPATLLGFGIPMLMVGLGKLRQLRK